MDKESLTVSRTKAFITPLTFTHLASASFGQASIFRHTRNVTKHAFLCLTMTGGLYKLDGALASFEAMQKDLPLQDQLVPTTEGGGQLQGQSV